MGDKTPQQGFQSNSEIKFHKFSCSKPSQKHRGCPDWARIGQTGLAHSNPSRAPAGLAICKVCFPGQCPSLAVQLIIIIIMALILG